MNNLKDQLKYRAYRFSISIIKFSSDFPNKRIYWIIADQLLRSATSIGANIVEAQSASSKRDFIKFYEIALKSANETKYWLGILRDATETDKDSIYSVFPSGLSSRSYEVAVAISEIASPSADGSQ